MKKASFALCIAVIVLGLALAVGVKTFLAPCVHEDGSFGACHWAGQMLLGVGALLAALGLLALIHRDQSVRAGLLLAAAAASILGLLTPGTLISLCKMSTMRCRAIMQPAAMVLCALALLLSLAGALAGRWKKMRCS